MPGIFPDMMAPVVRTGRDGARELVMARWGMPSPPQFVAGIDRGVTNIRNVASPHWRGWLKPENRCLVPATSFCEYTDKAPKVPTWFALGADRPLFAFAGIRCRWQAAARLPQLDEPGLISLPPAATPKHGPTSAGGEEPRCSVLAFS